MKRVIFIVYFLSFFVGFGQRSDYAIAQNYYRNSEYEKASFLFKKLSEKSPYNYNYLKQLAECYQEIDSFSLAERTLTKRLKGYPKLTFINVLLANTFERQQQKEKANKFYEIAINSIDKVPSYASTIANLLKGYSKLDLAIKAYTKAKEKNPKSNYEFQIAQIHGEKGNFEQMFESYIDYLDKNNKLINTVKHYTGRYITDDAENENNILFKKALLRRSASKPKDVWNNLLSWLFTKQKDYGKAFIQEKALYTRNADNLAGVKQLSRIAFVNEDYAVAKKCFDFVIERTNYPRDKFEAISKNLLIAIKMKEPNVEEQFQQAFSAYGINRNTFPVQLIYAKFLTFEKKKPEKAKEILESMLKLNVSKYSKAHVKMQLADVLVYQGKFNKALIYLSQVQTKFKNHPMGQQARFKVAQTSYFKNDFKWAKAQLKVLKGSATQLIANDAADLFLIISDNQPKDSIPTGLTRYAKADLYHYQKKNNEASEILSNIIIDFKGQPIEDEALFKQAEIYTEQGKFQQAITNFNNIIALDKKGIFVDNSLFKLAEIYNNKLNDKKKAQEYYQKIIFDYPSSIYLVDARKNYRKLRGDEI